MARVRWTSVGRRDLRTVLEPLAAASPSAAKDLRLRVGAAATRLATYPLLGRVVPEYENLEFRELIVGRYRLVYRVIGEEVEILSLVHGSRDKWRHLPEGPWDID